MNTGIINYIFKKANNQDYLKIDYGSKSLEIPKRVLNYSILNKGFYLELENTAKKETYLIKTDSIDLITIIEPKFKGMSWYDGKAKAKVGA